MTINFRSVLYTFMAAGLFVGAGLLVAPGVSAAAELDGSIIETKQCGGIEVAVHGYGAGLMMQTSPITHSVPLVLAFDANSGCAVLGWATNAPATAQVIFGRTGAIPGSADVKSEPYLGFPQGTMQDNSGTTEHKAVLTGLTPGQSYTYRIVTRSHPGALPQVSGEYTFTMGAGGTMAATSQGTAPITITVTTAPAPAPTQAPTPYVAVSPPVTTAPTEQKEGSGEVSGAVAGAVEVAADDEEATGMKDAISVLGTGGSGVETTWWERLTAAVGGIWPDREALSLTPGLGLFAEDSYIVPTLFFLLLLFLLQQLLLPALGMPVQRPLMFWMFGAVSIAVLAALLGYYAVTVLMLALFVVLLAWYLLSLIPHNRRNSVYRKFSGYFTKPQ